MSMSDIIWSFAVGLSLGIAGIFGSAWSATRGQLKMVQSQLASYESNPECRTHLVPRLLGLWPYIDEKDRLKSRIAELQRDARTSELIRGNGDVCPDAVFPKMPPVKRGRS